MDTGQAVVKEVEIPEVRYLVGCDQSWPPMAISRSEFGPQACGFCGRMKTTADQSFHSLPS